MTSPFAWPVCVWTLPAKTSVMSYTYVIRFIRYCASPPLRLVHKSSTSCASSAWHLEATAATTLWMVLPPIGNRRHWDIVAWSRYVRTELLLVWRMELTVKKRFVSISASDKLNMNTYIYTCITAWLNQINSLIFSLLYTRYTSLKCCLSRRWDYKQL